MHVTVTMAMLLFAPAAGPTVTVAPPAEPLKWVEFAAAPGRSLTLTSDKAATWLTASDGVLTPWPDGKGATFTALAAGEYRLFVVTAAGVTPVAVKVGGGPSPGPGPSPPGPNPPPADPIRERLKVAFDADPAPLATKNEARKYLAELYRQAAQLTAGESVQTAGQLYAAVKQAAETLAPNALVGVRKVVAEELSRVLPTDANEELTPTYRKAAGEVFTRLAAALESFE